jgi:hypothetical protein
MTTDETTKPVSGRLRRLWEFLSELSKKTAIKVRESLTGLISPRTVLAVVIGLVLLHLFDLIAIPFAPFTTTGKIFVDSPEVYTRERLVNDRYDQDFWLRQRLEKLNDPENLNLVIGAEYQSVTARAGKGGAEEGAGQAQRHGDPEGANPARRLSFEQEFRVASGIRDMIRQQILENMLDDRHDLTGNSVYGLKFDTTVIPGHNTRRSAFVHVSLRVNDLFRNGGESSGDLPEYIRGWIASKLAAHKANDKVDVELLRRFKAQERYYEDWLTDVEKRLNRAEDSVYESIKEKCPKKAVFYDKLTRKTLETVLGIPEETFWLLNKPQVAKSGAKTDSKPQPVQLPDPWASFFYIEREPFESWDESGGQLCHYRVCFSVSELSEQFIIVQSTRSEPARGQPQDSEDALIPLAGIEGEETNFIIKVPSSEYEWRKTRFGVSDATKPKYPLSRQVVEELLEVNKRICNSDEKRKSCDEKRLNEIEVRAGLFNFVERMSARDAYSYAIFPKNDVVGVFAETSAQLSAAAPATGFFDLARRLRESTTTPVLVGYGDASGRGLQKEEEDDQAGRSIDFGWVISARGDMELTQKNELAVVSVPAWAEELELDVSVGWLDRRGNPELDEDASFKGLKISVPPNLEVFDSIFREDARVTLGPSIRNNEMDTDIYVRAGKETKFLIPGSRLWRSASVTLGAQTANRIRVLPNMEGIIAKFDHVEPPYAAYDAENEAINVEGEPDTPTTGQAADAPKNGGKPKECQ